MLHWCLTALLVVVLAAPHICFSSHPPLLACRSAAPTGDGKSLVAEVVMLRALAAEKSRGPGVACKAMLVRRLGNLGCGT